MTVQADKEEASPVGVYAPQEPARVDVPENMPNGGECQLHVRGVVYGKEQTRE